jgi:uncharacterized RDD family membrane protein YckC/cytoskeletal protein CcmA (bactofilin family)
MKNLPLSTPFAVALATALLGSALSAPAAFPSNHPYYAQADVPPAPPEPPPATSVVATSDVTVSVNGRKFTSRDVIVRLWEDVHLTTNDTAEVVVVIVGDVQVDGTVKDTLVMVGGDATVTGKVAGDLVVVGGGATVTGNVEGDLVVVGGTVRLQPGARVEGDVISVGGRVETDVDANVGGDVQDISLGLGLPGLTWLTDWLVDCLLKLRPLSFRVGWVWGVAAALLLLYLLTGLVLRRPVRACVRQFEERPATTFLAGLLGVLLVPLVLGILMATGVGLLAIPFLLAALMIAVLIGKVALFEYAGAPLGRLARNEFLQKPLVAFLIGWTVLTLLSVVPILGFALVGVTMLWGFGAALMALFARSRQERPPAAPTSGSTAYAPVASGLSPALAGAAFTTPFTGSGDPPVIPAGAALAVPAFGVPEALAYPRASFWQRMGAGAIDILLIGVVSAVLPIPMSFLLATVAYFTAMWAWKGSTIGGTVVGLKVVRLDGRPLDWTVALVRSLGAWLSTTVLFLGFFWIAWDDDRQGWHDRIAGTVVLKLPRGTPLLSL